MNIFDECYTSLSKGMLRIVAILGLATSTSDRYLELESFRARSQLLNLFLALLSATGIIVILCVQIFPLKESTSFKMFKIVPLSSFQARGNTNTSLLLWKISTGCLSVSKSITSCLFSTTTRAATLFFIHNHISLTFSVHTLSLAHYALQVI